MFGSKKTSSEDGLGSSYQSANVDQKSIQKAIKALQDILSDKEVGSIEEIFKKFDVKMEFFEDYEYIVNLHSGLILLADSLTVKGLAYLDEHQTSKTRNGDKLTPLLDDLKKMADIVVFSKIIVFMRYALDATKKRKFYLAK